MNSMRVSLLCLIFPILVGFFAMAQNNQPPQTVARPLTEKEKKKQEDRLRKELKSPYVKWENEDVAFIITDEERATLHRLQNDEEREQFIEQFWLRRDPTPDTIENEYKEEHYRRIAYANEHFASGIPGWRSDRGRIYIVHGPPDEREEHPSGGAWQRPASEGGGSTSTYSFEQWRYRHLDGVGEDIVLEFVDPSGSGEYRLTSDPSEKDALLYVPGAGLTLMEQRGLSNKSDRFNRPDGTHLGVPFGGQTESMNEFTRLAQAANVLKPPAIKFGEMETAFVSVGVRYNILPLKVQVSFFPVTGASVLTYVTLQFDNKDFQFIAKEGVQKAAVSLLGRITTITRRPAATFEDTVTVDSPNEMLASVIQRRSVYSKCIPLAPGPYRLNVVAKDIIAGNVGLYELAIMVPALNPDALQGSSIVLADQLDKVATRSAGAGQFVIGDDKVRPRVDTLFHRGEKLGVYWKVYNLATNDKSRMPAGQLHYEVIRDGTALQILEESEDLSRIPGAAGSQVTIRKFLDLPDSAPGRYTLRLKITDGRNGQTLTQTVPFSVM
jgi:GWxTD domain-containing protein